MRNWIQTQYTDDFKHFVDNSNQNASNGSFVDNTMGTILCNGVLFDGTESVNGMIIRPLVNVLTSGQVQSDTIFDNFNLYFRDTNNFVKLDQFPVDLLSYADGIPHFLYIKEDLSYRVDETMFGLVDEVLLCRFCINLNSTWNHMYIMAQRVGTTMYAAADEFYDIAGMYVASPELLKLSQTEGTIKRSGIDFTDTYSPDTKDFYNQTTQAVPLRYITTSNEIDYTASTTTSVITDKKLTYNQDQVLISDANATIRNIRNAYFGIVRISNEAAEQVHQGIVSGASNAELQNIVVAYTNWIDSIYTIVQNLYDSLEIAPFTNDVDRSVIQTNMTAIDTFMNTRLKGSALSYINELQVAAIRAIPSYVQTIDSTICSTSLDAALDSVETDIDALEVSAGSLTNVPSGKFTIQRILWDIYENCLIVQYGDTIYDTFSEATEGSSLVSYPSPYAKMIYIPLAILIVKSGISSINNDTETVIIERRWNQVDVLYETNVDTIARTRATKALNDVSNILDGSVPSPKADSLLYSLGNGGSAYANGDYYLNYSNLTNKLIPINSLSSSTYNSLEVLSAYQGYNLSSIMFKKDGSVAMTGSANMMSVLPKSTNSYTLGSASNTWNYVYSNNQMIYSNIYHTNTYSPYTFSPGGSVRQFRAMADSSINLGNYENGTIVFGW